MSALHGLAEKFFRCGWELFPTSGSRAGLGEYDGRLEEPTADLLETRRREIAVTAAALADMEPPVPNTDAFLDRQAFESHLTVAELRLGTVQSWRHDPCSPLTEVVESIFELLTRRDLTDTNVVASIIQRLDRVPRYLRAAQSRLSDPVRLWASLAEKAGPGSVEFLREAAAPLTQQHPRLAPELQSATQRALEAVDAYVTWVRSLKDRTLREDFAVGGDCLRQLIRDWHGLPLTPAQVEQQGWDFVQYYRDELEEQAKRIDPNATWSQILDRSRAAFADHQPQILASYASITRDLRARMSRDGILTLPPREECKVVATPAFLRPLIPTAAYSHPGPLDPRQVGVFFVTEPDPALPAEAYRANVGQHYGIEATCVHEAYPGHHVQLCWANRAASLIRQLADHVVFMEGWTLYCEQLMIDEDWFDDPVLRINHLAEQLWRAYRMVIDVGIHTRKMTVVAAMQLLMDGVGFTRERAETELNWYTQSPGVPMSYMLGKRETIALKERFMKLPGADTRRFHRWLLSFGSVPPRWLHAYLPDRVAS
jgi:uncharacterized protein (DUF885 family)